MKRINFFTNRLECVHAEEAVTVVAAVDSRYCLKEEGDSSLDCLQQQKGEEQAHCSNNKAVAVVIVVA